MLIDSEELLRRLASVDSKLLDYDLREAVAVVEQMVEEKEEFWAEVREGGSSDNDCPAHQDTDRASG